MATRNLRRPEGSDRYGITEENHPVLLAAPLDWTDWGQAVREIAEKLGRKERAVANCLRYLARWGYVKRRFLAEVGGSARWQVRYLPGID